MQFIAHVLYFSDTNDQRTNHLQQNIPYIQANMKNMSIILNIYQALVIPRMM